MSESPKIERPPKKEKDPKRVAAGKKLQEYNRAMREENALMKEELSRQREEPPKKEDPPLAPLYGYLLVAGLFAGVMTFFDVVLVICPTFEFNSTYQKYYDITFGQKSSHFYHINPRNTKLSVLSKSLPNRLGNLQE